MRASTIVALSFTSLVLVSTAASAEEKAKPAAPAPAPAAASQPAPAAAKAVAKGVYELDKIIVSSHPQRPMVAVDVARLVPRAPLPDLRQPLVDRIAAAVEKDPF